MPLPADYNILLCPGSKETRSLQTEIHVINRQTCWLCVGNKDQSFHFKPRSDSVRFRTQQPEPSETEHATTGILERRHHPSNANCHYQPWNMAAASTSVAIPNDAENRIVGMMVGSAVADAIGIYTNGLTKVDVDSAYGRRRILASYKASEVSLQHPDDHRAMYEVSSVRTHGGRDRATRVETSQTPGPDFCLCYGSCRPSGTSTASTPIILFTIADLGGGDIGRQLVRGHRNGALLSSQSHSR